MVAMADMTITTSNNGAPEALKVLLRDGTLIGLGLMSNPPRPQDPPKKAADEKPEDAKKRQEAEAALTKWTVQQQMVDQARGTSPTPFGVGEWTRALEKNTVWSMFFGCLITGAALALGAPFWFGLLQLLSAIRAAGPKPASTAIDVAKIPT